MLAYLRAAEGGSDAEHESEGLVDSVQFGRVQATRVRAEALWIDDGDLVLDVLRRRLDERSAT